MVWDLDPRLLLGLLSPLPWIAIFFSLDCYPLPLNCYPLLLELLSTFPWIAIHSLWITIQSNLDWYPPLLGLLSTPPWIDIHFSLSCSPLPLDCCRILLRYFLSCYPLALGLLSNPIRILLELLSTLLGLLSNQPWIDIHPSLDCYPINFGLLSFLPQSTHVFFFFLIKWLYFKIFFILCGIIIWTDTVWMVYARRGSVLKSFWIVGLVV